MISIIIPVYNYEKLIGNTISALKTFTENTADEFEIIFVDDCSRDNTVCEINKLIVGNMRLVERELNGGKGAAIKEGIDYCTGSHVIFTDADLPYDLKSISLIFDKLKSGFDVVLGSRDLDGSSSLVPYGKRRRILSFIFSILANGILLERISDTQCGVKGFSSDAAKKIFSELESKRFSFDVELIYLAQKLKFKIGLVPVVLVNHGNSSVKILKDGFRMLYDLISLYIRVNFLKK